MKLSCVAPVTYHPHTGFHYSKHLTYLSYDYCSFSNISGMYLGGSGYRQILFLAMCLKISCHENTCSGFMLASGWLPVSVVPVMDGML
jgi:hypothetical protein